MYTKRLTPASGRCFRRRARYRDRGGGHRRGRPLEPPQPRSPPARWTRASAPWQAATRSRCSAVVRSWIAVLDLEPRRGDRGERPAGPPIRRRGIARHEATADVPHPPPVTSTRVNELPAPGARVERSRDARARRGRWPRRAGASPSSQSVGPGPRFGRQSTVRASLASAEPPRRPGVGPRPTGGPPARRAPPVIAGPDQFLGGRVSSW